MYSITTITKEVYK